MAIFTEEVVANVKIKQIFAQIKLYEFIQKKKCNLEY